MGNSSKIYDVLILGAGPAGLAAALALARVHRTAAVFSSEQFRNDGVTAIHTVPSRDHFHPTEFRSISKSQILERYTGIEFHDTLIVEASKIVIEGYDGFKAVDDKGREWTGRKMVIATGSKDIFPPIEGYAENWPHNIYQCLFCDGHERAHLPAGILTFPSPFHLYPTLTAKSLGTPSVTVFSNGPIQDSPPVRAAIAMAKASGCIIDERKIARLGHAGEGVDVIFEDGNKVNVGFLFHKPYTDVGARSVIEGLGVEIIKDPSGAVVKRTEPFGESNVKGVFIAGDIGTPFKQVTAAMATGVAAIAGLTMQLFTEEGERALVAANARR